MAMMSVNWKADGLTRKSRSKVGRAAPTREIQKQYGERKVIYVQIRFPDAKNGKMMSVYGRTFREVVAAIDDGLTRAFGKVGAKRPRGKNNS